MSTRSLSRNFPDALELLCDVALHPNFPQAEIERVRSERLTGIVQEKDEPFALATRVLSAALYGARHTYGFPDSGTTESTVRSPRGSSSTLTRRSARRVRDRSW